MAKILLADDDPLLIRAYQKKFENDGHEIVTADDSDVDLTKIRKFKPDIILLDIMMPRVNGPVLLEKFQKDKLTKKDSCYFVD